MYLSKQNLQHLNTVTHEGKVVVFATDADGKISYTVKQDGFEDSYLNTPADQRTGWENWQYLEFPNEADDQSVINQETAKLTHQKDTSNFILRSRYKTQTESAVAPVQGISALGHVYIFRQSKSNTLLIDRFVLDGMTNNLNRKLEVRFKRSKQKHTPTKNMNKGSNGLVNIDSLDFRDANGNFFYEPTTELCLINNLYKGWFSIVLVPTIENDVYRWHIFAYNSQTQKVELTTIRASGEGLFDVQDYTIFEEENETLVPRRIPGIIKRTLDIKGVAVTNGLSATKYDLQQAQQTQSGEEQLLKTATKLMLAVPTDKGTAAFSFGIAGDGTLAEIDDTPDSTIIRSRQREVLLPLNTLDEIKSFADITPPPTASITGFAEGTDEEEIEDLVKISTDGKAAELANGDLVKITGTSDYQGLYRTQKVDNNTFDIDLPSGSELGSWEKEDSEEGGLIFDGMITAYQKTANGKLRVTCPNHGLENGDEVQITGTEDYNNTYPVQKIDDTHFVIERKWAMGEAINIKRLAQKRRGIEFDGHQDYIEIPNDVLTVPSDNKDFGATCSAWINCSVLERTEQLIVGQKDASMKLIINQKGQVAFQALIDGSLQEVVDPNPLPLNQWVHYAGVVDSNKKTRQTTLMLCKNGVEVIPQVFQHNVTVLEPQQELQARDKKANANFGNSVAISGDTAIVGAPKEDSGTGSSYIFQREADGTWTQKPKLHVNYNLQSDNYNGWSDYFGRAVAISGDTAIVGARVTLLSEKETGSAYIFQREADGTWTKVDQLQASDKQAYAAFGNSVAISGDTAIVGAPKEDTGIGSAYIFQRKAGSDKWTQKAQLQASDKLDSDFFGNSVAISGDIAIVGAPKEDKGTGSVYIFQREADGTWTQKAKFQASDKQADANFGNSVAISGDIAIVGAPKEDKGTGSVYIFQRGADGTWTQKAKFQASDKQADANFGNSVAISGDTAIVGAYYQDTDSKQDAGSAYIFQREADGTWTQKAKLQASNKQAKAKFGNSVAISEDTAIVGACYQDTDSKQQDAGSAYIFTVPTENQFKSSIGDSFIGKISDVQIWNIARTAEDIKNNMYLQLTGQEVGLVGYWRLGAISEGQVIDFSVNGNNGTVYGDVYVSAQQLGRKLTGKTDAVKYSNPELFAVSERATYEESFEFKVKHDSKLVVVDLNYLKNADGQGQIFTFSYWGKRSRNAEEEISINGEQNEFKASDGGWYKASCNVTIPEGVSLLRSFEIKDIKGDWTSLEIRKHRIRLLSDSITEAKYTDSVTLKTLADRQATLSTKLGELEPLEKEEADKLKRKREIEELLKPGNKSLQKQTDLIEKLKKEEENAKNKYNQEFINPVNYWLEIKNNVDISWVLGLDGDKWAIVEASSKKPTQWWQLEPTSTENIFKLKNKQYNDYLDVYLKRDNYSYGGVGDGPNYPKKGFEEWKLDLSSKTTKLENTKSQSEYKFLTIFSIGNIVKLSTINTSYNSVLLSTESQCAYWQLERVEPLNNVISDCEKNWKDKTKELEDAKSKLKDLQLDKDALNKELGEIKKQLDQEIEPQLTTKNREILGIAQPKPQTLSPIKKVKGLVTQGAILGFVKPASRLNAIETCEGNVQLSYFDIEGRMRQINYDVTADSNNSTVEQWLPDARRVCLKLIESNSVVLLKDENNQSKPLRLIGDWTIEAWFFYPFPLQETTEWNTLTKGEKSGHHIRVKDGKQLGIYLENLPEGLADRFYDSGYNLELLTTGWHHLTAVGRGDTTLFYIDGKKVGDVKAKVLGEAKAALADISKGTQDYKNAEQKVKDIEKAVLKVTSDVYYIGNSVQGEQFGKLAEIRIWGIALSEEEIAVNSQTLLTGNEPGLLAYYPMNETTDTKVLDHTGNGYNGTVSRADCWWSCTAPIGKLESKADTLESQPDALVCSEYSTVTIDPITKRKQAIMRCFLGYPTQDGVTLLSDKRIEQLELKWIGNAQFAPTLLGYIEGAPPVPSENLTLSDDYNGATSVELTMSEDVAFSWKRTQDSGLGSTTETFIGAGETMSFLTAPMGMGTSIDTSFKAGFKGNFEFSYQFQNESSITSSSSLSMTDKLELRGTPEETPKFSHLGTRFIPKNIGYALVVSAIADVFVTRLARSGKMVGYQVQPVDGIPPDVNTITFLMNPAYTMNGSLDGMTGSSATTDRFFKHVPEMRSQYGSLYPASYYRLQEAYDLKRQIEAEDKRRESYFSNFDVRLVDETSLARNIDSGDVPTMPGLQREEDKPSTQMTDEENKQAQEDKFQQFQVDTLAASENTNAAAKAKQAEIESQIKDQEKRMQATESFEGWQKRMEDIQIRAGKRNIVNTYVWDADGGLRTEQQSFANTVEHTIGGSYTMNAKLGVDSSFKVGADVELTAQATVNLTQTMNKTEARSKGFELNVDLSGLEYKGVTDYNDRPILPGEKVDRYRFMSFYLEGSTNHFQDFFNYVVDPEWLQSNDEEARALRQAQAGKPNKAWRVLHRVTYVERPALMGFGRDVRKLRAAAAITENQQILDKIAKLEDANRKLEEKLDKILNYLQQPK
ncbi:Integrin alpha-9 [Planktothrix tepida]|uniref:LamG-like jellyroll fold domain-containing protein n=1 Tax=Planktothrix tepida TaxID=1678309 RepID=UPI0020B33B5B|nr:LamG-like jellyroll fold domain-containing protein [Planktothrix tepida]CAD5960121.1 Integrin alpha-9 [Planktothrix tepida]